MPPTLTLSKGFLEDKVCSPGFGPARKRPLVVKAELEDAQDGERASHAEKRAKLSTGEDLLNTPSSILHFVFSSHLSCSTLQFV